MALDWALFFFQNKKQLIFRSVCFGTGTVNQIPVPVFIFLSIGAGLGQVFLLKKIKQLVSGSARFRTGTGT
jgi:hypothetical protein